MKYLNKAIGIFSWFLVFSIIPSIIYISYKEKKNIKEKNYEKCLELIENTRKEAIKNISGEDLFPGLFNRGIDYIYEESIKQCKEKFE
tara:strand:+ start:590 stop:853 length:264 start_codon:yes stop_codon:yes gene_type:complete